MINKCDIGMAILQADKHVRRQADKGTVNVKTKVLSPKRWAYQYNPLLEKR